MTVYAIIYSGKKTEIINGESYIADCVEVVAAFLSEQKANDTLQAAQIDVAEPRQWGVRSACVYPFEVTE